MINIDKETSYPYSRVFIDIVKNGKKIGKKEWKYPDENNYKYFIDYFSYHLTIPSEDLEGCGQKKEACIILFTCESGNSTEPNNDLSVYLAFSIT